MTNEQREVLVALHNGAFARLVDHDKESRAAERYELVIAEDKRTPIHPNTWSSIRENNWVTKNGKGAAARYWLNAYGRRALGVD